MRTKSLVIAAAALTASLLTASAQSNVYSLNIVGYVNTVLKGNAQYTLVSNPLSSPTNTINGMGLGALLPNKSAIVIFDGVNYFTSAKIAGVWGSNVNLPVGTGFFVKNGAAGNPDLTNTFVGNVIVGIPGTNTTAVPLGYSLVGTPVPVGGTLTDVGNNTLNLGAVLANKSAVVVFDGTNYFTSAKIAGVWGSNLTLSVGQGFYIKAQTAGSNWVQILQ